MVQQLSVVPLVVDKNVKKGVDNDMSRSKPSIENGSKTAVPNWIITFFLGLLVGLVVVIYNDIKGDFQDIKSTQKENAQKIEDRILGQEYKYQLLRERLSFHGWVFDKDGNILATPMDKKGKR
jgi:hypothetical protein